MKRKLRFVQNGVISPMAYYFANEHHQGLLYQSGGMALVPECEDEASRFGPPDWSLFGQMEEILDPWTLSENLEQNMEVKLQLSTAFAALSTYEQVLVNLSQYHGYSYSEIADFLHISPQNVQNRVNRALRRLRIAWNAENDH